MPVVLDLRPPGRLAGGLVALIEGLERRGVAFRALDSRMDTTTPQGWAFPQIWAAFAETKHNVIRQRAREGCTRPAPGGASVVGRTS